MDVKTVYDISVILGGQTVDFGPKPTFSFEQDRKVLSKEEWRISRLNISAHGGTHVDFPGHLYENDRLSHDFEASHFFMTAHVVDTGDSATINPEHIVNIGLNSGEAVLFKTSNSKLGRTTSKQRAETYVYMTPAAAQVCADKQARLVGFDYFVGEKPGNDGAPIHRTLLGNGTLILENANLKDVPPGQYTLICLPLKMSGVEASPVRAVLIL